MREKTLIIHWSYITPEDQKYYPQWKDQIAYINSIIALSRHLIEVDGSTRQPYDLEFDTAIIRRTGLYAIPKLVVVGDRVRICGVRASSCCVTAREFVAGVIGLNNVWIDPKGSWD